MPKPSVELCCWPNASVLAVVGFSGRPGGSLTDTMPNWVTYRWPPEYGKMLDWQWKEKVMPYWKEAARFAREHGIHKIAAGDAPQIWGASPGAILWIPCSRANLAASFQ